MTLPIIGNISAFFNDVGYGPGRQNTIISQDNDGDTLTTEYNDYFVQIVDAAWGVTLPDPSAMSGQTVSFTVVQQMDEGQLTINGTMGNGNSYVLSGSTYGSVTFISDGSNWWITVSYAG